MAYDELGILQAEVTKTANFSSVGKKVLGGTRHRGLFATVLYEAAANASGANAVTFTLEHSRDGGNTWFLHTSGAIDVVNLTTTAKKGVIHLPIDSDAEWYRIVATFSGAGSTPTITYSAFFTKGHV